MNGLDGYGTTGDLWVGASPVSRHMKPEPARGSDPSWRSSLQRGREKILFHAIKDNLCASPKHASGFPRHEIPQEIHGVHGSDFPGHMAQGSQPPEGVGAKQITAVSMDLVSHHESCQYAYGGSTQEGQSQCPRPSTHLSHISRRPRRASARVVPSTYSRSLPMGRPRANRVTRMVKGRSRFSR